MGADDVMELLDEAVALTGVPVRHRPGCCRTMARLRVEGPGRVDDRERQEAGAWQAAPPADAEEDRTVSLDDAVRVKAAKVLSAGDLEREPGPGDPGSAAAAENANAVAAQMLQSWTRDR